MNDPEEAIFSPDSLSKTDQFKQVVDTIVLKVDPMRSWHDTSVLDKDQMDALRLESQEISPSQKAEIDKNISTTHDALYQLYGKFIPVPYDTEWLQSRVISVKKGSKNHINKTFYSRLPFNRKKYAAESETNNPGLSYSRWGFILLDNDDYWHYFSDETKEFYTKELGSEEKAKTYLGTHYQETLLAHEITHLYENKALPNWLREAGAYYYAWEVSKSLGFNLTQRSDVLVPFYQSLVKKYGESVHQLYWGKQADLEFQNKLEVEAKDWSKKSRDFREIIKEIQ